MYWGTGGLWDALSPYARSPYAPSAPEQPSLLTAVSQLSPEERRRIQMQGLAGSLGKFGDALATGQQVGATKGQKPWLAALVAGLGTGWSAYAESKAQKAAAESGALQDANEAKLRQYSLDRMTFDDQRDEFRMDATVRREAEQAAAATEKLRREQLDAFKQRQRTTAALQDAGITMDPEDPRVKIALDEVTRAKFKPQPEPHPLSTARGLGYVKDGKFQVIPGTGPIRQERRGRDPEVEADRDYNAAAAAIDRRIAAVTGNPIPKPEDAAWLASMKDPAAKRSEIEREADLRTRRPRGEGADPLSSLGLKPGDPDAATAKQLLDNGMSVAEVKKLLEEARRARTGRK